MKKKILGSITLLLLTINLFANVDVSLSSPAVYRGDIVNYTISADGTNIDFPKIREIDKYPIIGTSSAQSINIINGTTTRTISKTYSFRPDKSLTIPSFSVKVDGKEYKTKELKVEVLKPQASRYGEPFILEMRLNKKEAFVGEPIELTISFKRKLNAHLDKLQLSEPKLDNFWVKKVDRVENGSEKDYIFEKRYYQIFPQKAGEFKIPPIEALIGIVQNSGGAFNDPFFSSFIQDLDWHKIYSNDLNLTVHPLPDNLELYGSYKIDARVDKTKVYANKPVNLTITIDGKGNIDDIKKFNPTIEGAIVYADEPKISSRLVNKTYQGTFTQKIAIIADSNFTIPSMELKYFDKDRKKVKTIKTKPIKIEVIGGDKSISKSSIEVSPSSKIEAPKVQTITKTKIVKVKEDAYIKYIFLAVGFILGAGGVLSFYLIKNRVTKRESDIVKAIKKAKSDRELFNILLPYAKKDKIISNALNKLEENIYKSGKNRIDREELMEVFE